MRSIVQTLEHAAWHPDESPLHDAVLALDDAATERFESALADESGPTPAMVALFDQHQPSPRELVLRAGELVARALPRLSPLAYVAADNALGWLMDAAAKEIA